MRHAYRISDLSYVRPQGYAMRHSSSPVNLIAKTQHGPPIRIQFVDDPVEVFPLSQLLTRMEDTASDSLPTYGVDGELYELVQKRSREAELPRFELSFPDSVGALPTSSEPAPVQEDFVILEFPPNSPSPQLHVLSASSKWGQRFVVTALAAAAVLLMLSAVGLFAGAARAESSTSILPR